METLASPQKAGLAVRKRLRLVPRSLVRKSKPFSKKLKETALWINQILVVDDEGISHFTAKILGTMVKAQRMGPRHWRYLRRAAPDMPY